MGTVNLKGKAMPEIPATSWEMIGLARDVLGVEGLNRIFKVERSQISRWSKNPDIFDDAMRNPLDKVESLLAALFDSGEESAALACIRSMAARIGKRIEFVDTPCPQHKTVEAELLDVPKACVLHQEAIQTGSTVRVVEHLEEQAIREIREATEAYRRKATKQ